MRISSEVRKCLRKTLKSAKVGANDAFDPLNFLNKISPRTQGKPKTSIRAWWAAVNHRRFDEFVNIRLRRSPSIEIPQICGTTSLLDAPDKTTDLRKKGSSQEKNGCSRVFYILFEMPRICRGAEVARPAT